MVPKPEAATVGVLRNFAKFTGKHLCQSLFFNKVAGVTVNIHSPKKALPSTYLLANKYSPAFSFPGSVYLPVNKYCLGKYRLLFSYSVSIIGHNSHRFTPKPSLRQIKFKFSPK